MLHVLTATCYVHPGQRPTGYFESFAKHIQPADTGAFMEIMLLLLAVRMRAQARGAGGGDSFMSDYITAFIVIYRHCHVPCLHVRRKI